MINRTEAELISASIHAARPEWPIAQLMTLVAELKTWPLRDLYVGLAYVAFDQHVDGSWVSASPYRVKEQGPWRTIGIANADDEQRRLREERDYRDRLARISARTQAIDACHLCDEHGYWIGGGHPSGYVCQHVDLAEAARRGAAAARAAIRPAPTPREDQHA